MSRRKQKFPLHITEDDKENCESRMDCENDIDDRELEEIDEGIVDTEENERDEVAVQVSEKIKALMVADEDISFEMNPSCEEALSNPENENYEENVTDEALTSENGPPSTESRWNPEFGGKNAIGHFEIDVRERLSFPNTSNASANTSSDSLHIDDSALTIVENECMESQNDVAVSVANLNVVPSLSSMMNSQQIDTFMVPSSSADEDSSMQKTYFVPVSVDGSYVSSTPVERMFTSSVENNKKFKKEAPLEQPKASQSFVCPVCFENFKSKRSFNSHILIHCQLVKGSTCNKRSTEDSRSFPSSGAKMKKMPRRNTESDSRSEWNEADDDFLPLDLSCRKSSPCSSSRNGVEQISFSNRRAEKRDPPPLLLIANDQTSFQTSQPQWSPQSYSNSFSTYPPQSYSYPHYKDNFNLGKCSYSPSKTNDLLTFSNIVNQHSSPPKSSSHQRASPSHSSLSDRDSSEDINENLANEARESEKDFYGNIPNNEMFLMENCGDLESCPLPLMGSVSGEVKKVRVASEEGAPMVYRIKTHAEQMLVSRILGINEETGDKIELYKCFQCGLAFPSISRLQSHLSQHKQRFVCKKCSTTYESRIEFTQHIQKEHLTNKDYKRGEKKSSECFDERSAENTVTVAALLSALRENSICGVKSEPLYHNESQSPRSEEHQDDKPERRDSPRSASPSSFDGESTICEESMNRLNHDQDIDPNVDLNNSTSDLFKMFSCRFCGKKFDRAFSCNRHERVHTGFKPCFCRICGRGFSEPRNLRHHVIRFHSDGSLRHLIKRDRRKRREDGSYSPSTSPVPANHHESTVLTSALISPISSVSIPILKEMGNTSGLTEAILNEKHHATLAGLNVKIENSNNSTFYDGSVDQNEYGNIYTNNLTKIFAATLDKSSRSKKLTSMDHSSKDEFPTSIMSSISNKVIEMTSMPDYLEPGEIRLGSKTKIVDDVNGGRRRLLKLDEIEQEDENGFDHSPQFSSYAPRLNIVDSPVNRDQALLPITDDIGRTFYECPYCHKLFGSTSDLNRHLDFHEDLRPYNCEYCDYSARTNSQLKVHKMRHEGIKQFSCDICNYNGVTQSDLNRHKKTQSHVARTQNVCNVCGLGFFSGSQKQVHIVQCHPEMEGASSLIQMSLGFPPSSSNG